ncbi:hypothetical protein ILUMI_23772 [Ignelater luminosus]|uniref:Vitellogenin domain-containing protein n=1 Tax=Ignelater luminosus TaxID=2038154 RepID=A0A8K0FZC9_IGNLU|nr:hypothetical protein ILUMI_23772 [Ignelater luminosus]
MNYLSSFLLAFLVCNFTLIKAFVIFVPNDKEIVYDYRVFFKAGALFPISHASECFVRGKLHIQSTESNNSIIVYLSDVKFRLYNGERFYKHELTAEDLSPTEGIVKDLMKPFKIVYSDNGLVKKIITEKEEKYATNMHKAIASMLQFNLERVSLNDNKSNEPYGFIIEEDSIQGKIRLIYNVASDGKNVVVKKMHERKTTDLIYKNVISNVRYKQCQADFEEPISSNSHQTYVIEKQDEHYLIKHIDNSGVIYIYPFLFKSQGQYTYVHSTLNFLNVVSIEKHLNISLESIHNDLEFEVSYIHTSGRFVEAKNRVLALKQLLEEMVAWLNSSHVEEYLPKQNELVDRLVNLLAIFDFETLENFYNDLITKISAQKSKQILEIFHQVLPFAGSRPSIRLINKIIYDEKVKDDVALSMLYKLPSYIKETTPKLLEDIEDLLNYDNKINLQIKKAAVLSFGRLIHEIFVRQVNSDKKQQFINLSKRYLDDFMAKVKSSQDLDTQVLYIQALINTKLPNIIDYLIPVIKHNGLYHHRIRVLAMWGMLAFDINSDQIYELFWPIFANRNENSEIRQIAYYIAMKSSVSTARLLYVFWETQGQLHTELFHFHYNFLKSIAYSKSPCLEILKRYAIQHLKLTPRPKHKRLSTFYQMDFVDQEYKFGKDFTFILMASDTSIALQIEINSQIFNLHSNDYKLFVRIDGLGEIHRSYRGFGELWSFIQSNPDLKDVCIQIIVGKHDETIQIYNYNGNDIKNINFFELFLEVKSSIKIDYEVSTKFVVATELGVPAIIDISMPEINYKQINVNKYISEDTMKLSLNNKYYTEKHLRYGISIYNPFADLWQGSNRYHSYNFVLPVYADLNISKRDRSMKISVKKHDNPEDNVICLQSHVQTMLFMRDGEESLMKSCPSCQNWVMATRGDPYRRNYTIFQKEVYTFGYNYEVTIYDSETPITKGKLQNLFDRLSTPNTKSFSTPIEYMVLLFGNAYTLLILQGDPSTHGLKFKATPIVESLVTQVDLLFEFNVENINQENRYLPGFKLNPYFTYTLKNNEKVLQVYAVNTIIDVNPGHTQRDIKMNLTRTIPGQNDYKIWLESNKRWMSDGVNSKTSIAMGQSTNEKTLIDVAMVGKRFEEQKTPYYVYEICGPYSNEEGNDFHSLNCLLEHTSIRDYTYNIKTTNLPPEYKRYSLIILNYLKRWYSIFHQEIAKNSENSVEDDIEVTLQYVSAHEVSIKVNTLSEIHDFVGIPINELTYWLFYPDNTHYSELYLMMHRMGLMHVCTINKSHIEHSLNQQVYSINHETPTEWTSYVNGLEGVHNAILLKRIEETNNYALRVTHENHTLEIYPDGVRDFKTFLDGYEISKILDHHAEDWFTYLTVRPPNHGIALTVFSLQVHIVFDAKQVIIIIPKDVKVLGHCISS